MKKLFPAIMLCIAAFTCYTAGAQCNSTFTYVQQGSLAYKFTANQVEQSGFTYNYTWNFSTMGTYYTSTVNTNFYWAGNYQVCLLVSIQDSVGTTLCTDSTCQVVTAVSSQASNCFPNLYFFNNYNPGGTTVNFSPNLSDYTNVSVGWNFGDGSQSSGIASPSHTYASFGSYNVCLYVVDTVQHCGDTVCNYVTVDSCPGTPYISWFQPVDGVDTISFNSGSSIGVTYAWDFGDGSTDTLIGTGLETHGFPASGEYYVCLTTGQGACQNSSCDSVKVDNCSQAVNFTYYTISDSFLQVYFYTPNDFSNVVNSGYYWTFGDGTSDSLNQWLTHDYPSLGTYLACFSANIVGCGLIQQCDTIALVCNLAASFQGVQTGTNSIEYILDTLQNYPGEIYQWTFGDSATGSTSHPVHVYNQPGNYTACLTVTDTLNGCTASSYCNNVTPSIWSDTICGHVWVDANLNGIQDSGEANYQNIAIDIQVTVGVALEVYTDSNGNYTTVVPSNVYVGLGVSYINNMQYTIPGLYGYSLFFTQDYQRQCGYDFGVVSNFGVVTGIVYDDLDLNGQYSSFNDAFISNQIIDVNGQPAAVSAGYNGYRILVPPGNYTLTIDSSSYYTGKFPIIPAQINASIPYVGAASNSNNFAINVPSSYNDLGIDIIPLNPIVPGWLSWFQVMVTNYGPYNTNTVTYNFNTPNQLSIIDSSGGNTMMNSLYWTINSVYAFNGVLSQPLYWVNPLTPINTDIYDTASLANPLDANPSNNSDTCHQITVSSFDPNNKLATESGLGPNGLIRKDQTLKYVIDFQNTGTSPAVNVVVRDVLDPNLDFSTFRYIGTSANSNAPDIFISHDSVYFRFYNIQLADSFTSSSYSKSWVCFSIKPKSTVTGGTHIRNTADIFFDYNSPVRTNTTLHTIEGPADVPTITEDGQLSISPNPFGAQTNVRLQNMPGDHYTYKVTDVLGRLVTQGNINNNQTLPLYRNAMSAGTYIISFYDETGVVKRGKIVAQ